MTEPTGPLTGVTVVDLTRVLAGPYCTMVLSDLGATVHKIEHPRHGDDARHIGPFVNGVSAYFASLNRGKHSIALDLKAPSDRERFEALLDGADVVVENFSPGVMDRLGYGWDTTMGDGRVSSMPRCLASATAAPIRAGPRTTWSCRPWAG